MSAAERWQKLFEGLEEGARVEYPDELQVAKVAGALGSVGLVKPFRWTSWQVPFPSSEEIQSLSLVDCVRQITRVVRAERTNEGVLWGALRSGALVEMCRVAHRHTQGDVVGPLPDLEPGS